MSFSCMYVFSNKDKLRIEPNQEHEGFSNSYSFSFNELDLSLLVLLVGTRV